MSTMMMTVPLLTKSQRRTCLIIAMMKKKGCHGRKLTERGPDKPDVSHLDPDHAAAVMKIWRTAQKKFTNSIAAKEAKRRQEAMKWGDQLSDHFEYTGVVADL
jgi:hypothetical protein